MFVKAAFQLSVFVGSRACAANHYVIAEKCGNVCPYVHIFGERRLKYTPYTRAIFLAE